VLVHQRLKRARALGLILWSGACAAAEVPEAAPPPPDAEIFRGLREGLPSLQLSTDFGSPALGLGTYRPLGQVESRGVRVGPATVRVGAHTGFGYNDNVALTQTNKISSFVYTLTPSVSVGLEGALSRYYLLYRGNYGRYASSSLDNYDEHNVVVGAAHSWTTRFRSAINYEYLRGHDPRGATFTGTTVPEEWVLQTLRAAASYGAEGAQGRIEGDVAFNRWRFADDQSGSPTREYNSTEIGGTFYYRVAPKTRALVQVRRTDITHHADPTLDNLEMQYLAGVTWEALASVTGTVRLGLMTKDFSSSGRDDFSGPSYEAAVRWSPLIYSTLDFTARRAFGETHEVGSSFVVNDVATLSWNHDWPRAIRSTAIYTYGQVTQEGLGRTDTYHRAGLKVSYAVRRWLQAGAEYRRDVRDSTNTAADYQRNLTFITLEAAL
jgi:polysaccharide biosynthesis protein VpsM